MSSAPHARVSSQSERRTASGNESKTSRPRRVPSALGSAGEQSQRHPSPPVGADGIPGRTASGSQRTNRGVEERRTERLHVTTRETLTSRTRSPERRAGPPASTARSRPTASPRIHAGNPRPKSSLRGEIQSMSLKACRVALC